MWRVLSSVADSTNMTDSLLEQRLMLHPQVALRPEQFGALAYHYGNRKLVFLKHQPLLLVHPWPNLTVVRKCCAMVEPCLVWHY